MDVGEDREERRLVESVFDAAQHECAVRVGHVENHDADSMAAAAAQRARKQVGTIAEMLGGFVDASFGGIGNVTGERRVVEDDGDGGGRKSAALGNVADGDCRRLRPLARGVGGCRPAGFRRGGISRRLRIGGFHVSAGQ